MKIILAAVIAIALGGAAWAACPKGTAYRCHQGANGKVICGCY